MARCSIDRGAVSAAVLATAFGKGKCPERNGSEPLKYSRGSVPSGESALRMPDVLGLVAALLWLFSVQIEARVEIEKRAEETSEHVGVLLLLLLL